MIQVDSVKTSGLLRAKRLAQNRGLPQLKVVPTIGLGGRHNKLKTAFLYSK